MATHSKLVGVAVLAATAGACLTAAWYLMQLMRQNTIADTFDDYEIRSSQHTIIEVPVSDKIVGGVIGRNGTNIKKIEGTTSTKINFKDQDKDKNMRIAVIRGKPNDAQAAERLIRKLIAERMSIVTSEITVLNKLCGILIGKQGANIRRISQTSKTRITVEQSSDSQEFRTVTIKGTESEIECAKAMIEESLSQARENKKGEPSLSTSNKQVTYKDRQLAIGEETSTETGDASQVQPLIPTGKDGFLDVFISTVVSPSLFWVQLIGNVATKLDKLVDSMTEFYEDPENCEKYKLETMEVGDLVAAPFPCDGSIYRSRILSVTINDYNEEDSVAQIFYVDFGEYAEWTRKEMFALDPDFRKLMCQATECMLAGVARPEGATDWSEEAVTDFRTLTCCAQWKSIMLREEGKVPSADGSTTLVVKLVNTSDNVDVDIAKELILGGHARSTTDD